MELGIKLSLFLIIVAYAIDFIRLNIDVYVSLPTAFDLSMRRLLSITVDLLDLHHMPVGDKEACACTYISNLHHQDLFQEELHNLQMVPLHPSHRLLLDQSYRQGLFHQLGVAVPQR